MTNNASIQEVLFFPQMRPEKVVEVVLSEEEKAVFDLLKQEQRMLLDTLKDKAGLSNKKWDKTIKGLTKNKLVKVEKSDDGLYCEVI